jgi:FkbM family methyltransferase
MGFERIRVSATQWLARTMPASPALGVYPGWRLGSGERRSGRFSVAWRRQIWHVLSAPLLIPWLDGLRIYAYPGNETSRSVFVTGCYEPNEFCLLARILQPGMIFVDGGANMGLYTLFAARKIGKRGTVLAIEPSSRECEHLLRNVAANSLSNVRILRMAVSQSHGTADLRVAADRWSGHNTLGAFAYDTPQAALEKVPTDSLDNIVAREGFSRVDVVKLDIEGAELLALQGAAGLLERFRPVLLLEIADRALCHQGCTSGQIWEFLADRGYRIYSFDERTGFPVPALQKPRYDSENVVAVPDSYQAPWRSTPLGVLLPGEG